MQSVVHLVRHGQVHNPDGILYGRLPGYGLSDIGRAMAQRLGEHFADVPLTHLRCSPLQRARETMAPTAAGHSHLEIATDERVIEAANQFEGMVFGSGNAALRDPAMFWHMRNPLRPSWGEAYTDIAARMRDAIIGALDLGTGGEVLMVSHQLPIWTARRFVERRPLWHDPRRRQCSLASMTSLVFEGRTLMGMSYWEPAAEFLAGASDVTPGTSAAAENRGTGE